MSKYMNGESMIEVLIALAVAGVLITTVTVTIIASLRNTNLVKQQNNATQYAQEGIEIIRRLRDKSFIELRQKVGQYCLNKGMLTLPAQQSLSCMTPNVDEFIRRIVIQDVTVTGASDCSRGQIRSVVNVSWSDSKCPSSNIYCHKAELSSCLSNLYQVTP